MYITDRLVYLQLQKTGCTHIAKLLEETVGGYKNGKHNRMERPIPGRMIVGSVRNPWDWYVSLWAFGCGNRGSLFRRTTARSLLLRYHLGTLPEEMGVSLGARIEGLRGLLASTRRPVKKWQRVYSNANDPGLFREWLGLVLDPARKHDLGEGYSASPVSRYAGIFTYRYMRLYVRDPIDLFSSVSCGTIDSLRELDRRDNMLDAIIRNECLEEDLLAALQGAGHRISDEHKRRILGGKRSKTNTSSRRDASFYYDDETIGLVADRERFIIQKYAYRPPFESSDSVAYGYA